MDRVASLFGSRRRAEALMMLAVLEESYGGELARAMGVSPQSLHPLLVRLEEDGVLVGIPIGKERRLRLNPRFPEHRLLRELLVALADRDEAVIAMAGTIRRRPRARNKPL